MRGRGALVGLALALLVPAFPAAAQPTPQAGPRWFSAWAAPQNRTETALSLSDATVRTVVRPTLSGRALRIKLENTLGTSPVTFSGAWVGVPGPGASVVPGTNLRLMFTGDTALTLEPGAGAWSDPVDVRVVAFQRLVVSLDVAAAEDASTHTLGLASNHWAWGRRGADPSGEGFEPIPPVAANTSVLAFPVYWVAALDVLSDSAAGTIVPFGDSITDGRCSTTLAGVVRPDLHQRWPDLLAERLAARASGPDGPLWGLANAGIAGNRIIVGGNGPPGLERLERDVLERAGVTHVIFFEGTNDLAGGGATAEEVIEATQRVIERAKARGLKIYGATIIPRGGPDGTTGWSPDREAHRQAVNAWIRTQAPFDGVLDFAALLGGGPAIEGAESIRPEFNCDYTHPNAAGYRAMAEMIDLSWFVR
ncbi:MAG TPA: GDSL-type esterase/lipase family protein [Longimicrobiales bacterium]|nr:GDSL-type esterase/lipase family protein [Longimicrobiales bacterium]